MRKLAGLKPEKVFKYFEEISAIPRGSTNMEKISEYCVNFASERGLKFLRDEANNVVIFKEGNAGGEMAEPIILQGHLDMVCQKTEETEFDFEKDGLNLYIDGDFVKAQGTTLGADNGIAVAMILAILDSQDIPHPPIEAVFTTDEEIGMIGAMALSARELKGKRLINLDSEEQNVITVSCAGGSDFKITVPILREKKSGKRVKISLKGLQGGHSGVEIHKGLVNADMLAGRVLNFIKGIADFDIISVNGGDKGNAIPRSAEIDIITGDEKALTEGIVPYLEKIKKEISEREKGFEYSINAGETEDVQVMDRIARDKLIFMLVSVRSGVIDMSAEIENLVESSQNLGVLKTEDEKIIAHFTLRSNKNSALEFLEARLKALAGYMDCEWEAFGHYPPWEFKENSYLREKYKEIFAHKLGTEPIVAAIHAGLECGLFSQKIEGLDCIAIGPDMFDVHTARERLSISSTEKIYEVILELLKNLS